MQTNVHECSVLQQLNIYELRTTNYQLLQIEEKHFKKPKIFKKSASTYYSVVHTPYPAATKWAII